MIKGESPFSNTSLVKFLTMSHIYEIVKILTDSCYVTFHVTEAGKNFFKKFFENA